IFDFFKIANKFATYNINGKKESKYSYKYFFFVVFPWVFSLILVFISRDRFNFEFTTIGALLSLFTGLLFGLLLKISDKVREIPEKKSLKSENDKNKRTQELNYLKLFFYFLSYSIVISLFLISLIIIKTFAPELLQAKISNYFFVLDINLSTLKCFLFVLTIFCYRFFVVFCLVSFIMYILLSIIYLYEYIKFDFSKIQ
ncbi:hypothetical protein V2647_13100, partial [Tenacibaculum maritimum]|uniref:hypothetical protein n=1 Tax=Tenacibaculum maritimum TaxID=107401 RepID=UPI0038770CAB